MLEAGSTIAGVIVAAVALTVSLLVCIATTVFFVAFGIVEDYLKWRSQETKVKLRLLAEQIPSTFAPSPSSTPRSRGLPTTSCSSSHTFEASQTERSTTTIRFLA
jgi:hypothetical protein